MAKKKAKDFWIFYNSKVFNGALKIEEFGWHDSPPDYTFEEVRSNDIIHFVKRGICHLTVWEGQTEKHYIVNQGEAFFIKAGIRHRYVSDEKSPCLRYWISTKGKTFDDILSVCGLTGPCTVRRFNDNGKLDQYFNNYYRSIRDNSAYMYDIYSISFKVLSFFADLDKEVENDRKADSTVIVEAISNYIDANIQSVTVKELSSKFGYEESYMFRIFKKEYGISPKKYITQRRIILARGMLLESNMSVEQIAGEVGYKEASSFVKVFKQYAGLSPARFREKYKLSD